MRDLTKWPRLLVAGDSVTVEQAEEIIIRTNEWYLCINDHSFERAVYDAAGIDLVDELYSHPDVQSMREFKRCYQVLHPLHYLYNSRIASSWVGGPYGWVDWNGHIGCDNYNIGKWPSHESVLSEWETIAVAFPFLNLRVQLVPDEGAADMPAVEYRVHDGIVETIDGPNEWIMRIDEKVQDKQMRAAYARIFGDASAGHTWEHGASIEHITAALHRHIARMNNK